MDFGLARSQNRGTLQAKTRVGLQAYQLDLGAWIAAAHK